MVLLLVVCKLLGLCMGDVRKLSFPLVLDEVGFVAGMVQVGFLPKGIPRDFVRHLSTLSVAESADRILVDKKQEYSL